MKKNLLMIGMLAFTLSSFAEDRASGDKGNGGDAIVCTDGRVMLLDKYEAQKRNFKLDISGETLRAKVLTIVRRMKNLDPANALKVEKLALAMVSDIEISDSANMKLITLTDDLLTDIDDSLETSVPRECHKEQFIINKKITYAQDTKFEIRSDLWNKMDLDNKAMSITHESIYDWLIELGAEDSRFARFLNGYLAQDEKALDFVTYISNLKKVMSQGVSVRFISKTITPYLDQSLLSNMVTDNALGVVKLSGESSFNNKVCFLEDCTYGRLNSAVWDSKGNITETKATKVCRQKKDPAILKNGKIIFSGCHEWLNQNNDIHFTTGRNEQVRTVKSQNGIKSVVFNDQTVKDVTEVEINELGEIVSVK